MSNKDLSQLKLGREVNISDHLDPVPRQLSRQHLSPGVSFNGFDMWNAYEASFLLPNRMPVLLHLQIRYSATTPNIVESKSFKLFLNHFNFKVFNSVNDYLDRVRQTVAECVGGQVSIRAFGVDESPKPHALPGISLDSFPPGDYPDKPDATVIQKLATDKLWCYHTHLLRSRCPVTGQPDWGAVIVEGKGHWSPVPDSLLTYVLSFRSHQGFHEACCEAIFCDLIEVLKPEKLSVRCLYTRRGGLDINPFRTTETSLSEFPHLAWRQ